MDRTFEIERQSQMSPQMSSDSAKQTAPSIDDGHIATSVTTADSATDMMLAQSGEADFRDNPNIDLPLAAGPDLAGATSKTAALRGRATEIINTLPGQSLNAYRALESKAKENPWLAMAAASGASLAIGFVIGKLFFGTPTKQTFVDEEYPAGYDE